jgi:hypothetical protein
MPPGTLRRVSDPTDAASLSEAFIETYGTSSTEDSVTLVEQYEQVREYTAEHPNQGSSAVASALELPRGRIRSWVDGDGRPDAARGVDRLTARGWLHLAWEDFSLRALAVLVAWTIAGGHIPRDRWLPAWSVAAGTEPELRAAGWELGISWQRRHVDDDGSGTEWLVDRDGSVLGRLLGILGAPVNREGPALPGWLMHEACPRGIRVDVARVLVRQRGTRIDSSSWPVQVRATDRRAAIRRLFESVLDGEANVRESGEHLLRLDTDAVASLGQAPTLGDPLPGRE